MKNMKSAIIYGSRRGATEECATRIHNSIPDSTLCNVATDTIHFEDFDRIIIGGNACVGRLNKGLIQFVENHEEQLLTKSLYLFTSSGEEESEEVAKLFANSFSKKLIEKAELAVTFGGRYDSSRENILVRLLMKMMKKSDYDRVSQERIEQFIKEVQSC